MRLNVSFFFFLVWGVVKWFEHLLFSGPMLATLRGVEKLFERNPISLSFFFFRLFGLLLRLLLFFVAHSSYYPFHRQKHHYFKVSIEGIHVPFFTQVFFLTVCFFVFAPFFFQLDKHNGAFFFFNIENDSYRIIPTLTFA